MSFKSVRSIVRMGTPTSTRLLEPVFVVEYLPLLNPVQTGHRLITIQQLKVMTQPQQRVHHLPRSMLLRRQHPAGRCVYGLLAENNQGVSRFFSNAL